MVSPIDDFIEFKFTVDKDDLMPGVLEVVSRIKPSWTAANVKHTVFKDGITNKLVGVHLLDDEQNMILVRIYGENTSLIIDRESEIKNIQTLQARGFAPKLYASFSNGLAYQYLPGDILTVSSCREDNIFRLVAQHMASFHRQFGSNDTENQNAKTFLWDKMECFLSLAPKKFCDPVKQEIFTKFLPSIEDLRNEFEWMKSELEQLNSPLSFCHNDLLLANILYNQEKHSIHFIDFEYAGINFLAYDIANHFCEFAGVDNVDHSLYPDESFRRKWISNYLETFNRNKQVVDNVELERLMEHVEMFSIAAHFFWGVWSIVQAANSSIPFDFLGYAISRLGEYFRRKTILLK